MCSRLHDSDRSICFRLVLVFSLNRTKPNLLICSLREKIAAFSRLNGGIEVSEP
jgi:hypothetical protein